MSTDTMPEGFAEPEEQRPDYTTPIARTGEQQFAAIVRNRSGMDAGCIDFGLRDLSYWPEEAQDFCDIAYALYQAICYQTQLRAKNDGATPAPAPAPAPASPSGDTGDGTK